MSDMNRQIVYRQNTDYKARMQVLENGLAPDLSGATAVTFYARTSKDQPDAQAVAVNLLASPTNVLGRGQIGIEIADTDLAALAPGTYYWDVYVVKGDGSEIYYPDNPAALTIMGGGA